MDTYPAPTDLTQSGSPFVTLEGAYAFARANARATQKRWTVALRTVRNQPGGYPHRRWIARPAPECECWPTPVSQHYVYYGITEPGSAWEWNPDCPVHRGAHVDPDATGWPELAEEREDCHAAGHGPCVAACCPIRGMGLSLPCPPSHPVSSGVR